MNKKKSYIRPATTIVKLASVTPLLAASGPESMSVKNDTLGDDDEVW